MVEMITPLGLTIAYVVDLAVGDPQWRFHPVRLLGRMIDGFERALRAFTSDRAGETAAGCLLCGGVVALTYLLVWTVLAVSFRLHASLGFCVSVALVYFTLSVRALGDAAQAVARCLASDDHAGARHNLSLMVGRDTATLNDEAVARAAVETVAENTSDGIVAPLFYVALGGPALGMAYKAVNTLDSMVGYRTERYRALGWASARFDDLANYLPARLTALLLIVAAFFLHKDWKSAYTTIRRDAAKHQSLNSGYPESAVAGALKVQLGGPSSYHGVLRNAAVLGEGDRPLNEGTIRDTVVMMYLASALMLLLCLFYRGALT